ncbi:cation transporter [Cryobacterium sp. TMT2-15-1]|uniref:cation transporter n=1 Tax=Cryobacterium sp. TMT2-15-1 TaxID=1259246 RepID=UPI001882C62B|nr:cation transporter [Cryobacterium sp. TMT2-15-1]
MDDPGTLSEARRTVLHRTVRWIVGFTIGYNVLEAVASIVAGAAASSTALIAFGLDSVIEVLSAAVIAWQFSRRDPERWQKPALRAIAIAFFTLAGYVILAAGLSFAGVVEAAPSPLGIVIACLSLVIMPGVAGVERRTGAELGSASVIADARQLLLCAWLSGSMLLGLAANALLGWAWADSLAALVIAGFAIREGIEAWRGEAEPPVVPHAD